MGKRIKDFEVGKYYKIKEEYTKAILEIADFCFNLEMMAWFDHKPRKCLNVFNGKWGHSAKFEKIKHDKHDGWCYTFDNAMKLFEEAKPLIQEELEL